MKAVASKAWVVSTFCSVVVKAVASNAGVVSTVCSLVVKAVASKAWVVSTVCSLVVKAVASNAGVVSTVCSVVVKALASNAGVVSTTGSADVSAKVLISTLVVVSKVCSVVGAWVLKLTFVSIGLGSTNSWVKSVCPYVVSAVVVLISKLVFVSTAGVEAVKSILFISKLVLVVSKLFKAEVAPTIELFVVKSKLLFSISTFGSTDWKVSALKFIFPSIEVFSTIWALSAVSIIGEVAWYSPYWVSVLPLVACKTSISEVVLVVPKSIWAFVSKFIFVSTWAEEVKSIFVFVVVSWNPPTCKFEFSSGGKILTRAKSLSSPPILVKAWKSKLVFAWVSKPISFVVVSYWANPSVEVGIASADEEATFTLDEAGYSP